MNNKIAIVTGASTGIGREIAVKLACENIKVFLIGRTLNRLSKTMILIEKFGGIAEIIEADLANIDSINNLIQQIKLKTDRIDIIANIAGIWHGTDDVYADKNFEDFSQQIILDTYSVGLTAPTLIVHAMLPLMPEYGKIINLSGSFEDGGKGWIPYYVSKRAIEDLTLGLSQELMNKKIQVNGISPSDTATEAYKKYFPKYINEAIKPSKIADFVSYLCSSEGDLITGKVFVLKKSKDPFEGFHA